MNQIICTRKANLDFSIKSKCKKKKFFVLQLFILIIIIISTIIYYLHFRYDLYQKEQFSKSILENLELTKIYSSSSDYNAKLLNSEIFFYENSSFSTIGIIEISKLNISYPILSDINKDLLKISPCRFYRTYAKSNTVICVLLLTTIKTKLFLVIFQD